MERNIGKIDRIIRFIIGAVFIGIGFGVLRGAGGVALGVIGAIIFITGITGYCLLYRLLKINTYIRV